MYTHVHVCAHGYRTSSYRRAHAHKHDYLYLKVECAHCSANPFLSNWVSAPREAGSYLGLQGARKPGSSLRLGTAGSFIFHPPVADFSSFSGGQRPQVSCWRQRRVKEEVEGAPGTRDYSASLPRSVASLPPQVAPQGIEKRGPDRLWKGGPCPLPSEAIMKQATRAFPLGLGKVAAAAGARAPHGSPCISAPAGGPAGPLSLP